MRSNGLHGVKELQANLKQFGINADNEISKLVNKTAQNVRTTAIKSIQRGPASGEVYEKTKPNRTHQASAPGEAPATDTGRLASSVSVRKSGELTAYVFTPLDYGFYLEVGTQSIAPHPWLFPALEAHREAWLKGLNEITDRAARGIL